MLDKLIFAAVLLACGLFLTGAVRAVPVSAGCGAVRPELVNVPCVEGYDDE